MELAKARAADMKALIMKNPASALRLALPAELRSSLPANIAAAIEQPVEKSGMCSMRLECNHSADSPHEGCHSIPILMDDVISWNAYYSGPQWKTLVGQSVEFQGVAVDDELAVGKIAPAPVN